MEISSVELVNIVTKLNAQLSPPEGQYYLSNIYSIFTETFLFRFHHSSLPDRALIISPRRGLWITKYKIEGTSSVGYVTSMRKLLGRGRFVRAEQPSGERICIIVFDTPSGQRSLICEFFREGNLIVVDSLSMILSCQRGVSVRHRTISPGTDYLPPPSRGMSIFDLERIDLDELIKSNLEVSRWLGRKISTSKKYTEEILSRTSIDIRAVGSSLSPKNLDDIFSVTKRIAENASLPDSPSWVIYEDDTPTEVTLGKFLTMGGSKMVQVQSLMDGLDTVFTDELKRDKDVTQADPTRKKILELENSLQMQKNARESASQSARDLRNIASKLSVENNVEKTLKTSSIEYEVTRPGLMTITILGNTFEVEENIGAMKLSSRLFVEAKAMESRVRAIEAAETRLRGEVDHIGKKLSTSLEQVPALKTKEIPLWFERYRWFITSDGLLAIGGRDSHSNSSVVRKHTKKGDLVFHAEIVGSPFFILKNASEMNKDSIREVGWSVVSFSRAWREQVGSNAYWVKPDQVKASAPSGMYLPKGSFMIEGRKNSLGSFFPEIAVGVCRVENRYVLMSGPKSAISNNSIIYVLLSPERSKVSDTAKKLKAKIVSLLDDQLAPVYEAKSLDDFVRVLPATGGKIIDSGSGAQKLS